MVEEKAETLGDRDSALGGQKARGIDALSHHESAGLGEGMRQSRSSRGGASAGDERDAIVPAVVDIGHGDREHI